MTEMSTAAAQADIAKAKGANAPPAPTPQLGSGLLPPPPSDWADFLTSVDAQVPSQVILQRAVEFLVKECGLKGPSQAIGIQLDDLRCHPKWPSDCLATVAFLGRTANALKGLLAASAVAPPARNTATLARPEADEVLRNSLQVVTGGQASAAALAEALVEAQPNTAGLLTAAGLGDVPSLMLPTVEVFRVMTSEVRTAKRDGRTAYVFCDLTGDPFRPVWLTAEAVGGRATTADAGSYEVGSGTGSQLERALTRALRHAYLAGGGRFFRSLQQWQLCYQRFMVAAVATEMLTWAHLLAHQASVARIAESHANAQQGIYLAILYDELARKQWAMRAARGEIVDLLQEAHIPPTELVAAAQSRLHSVLQTAGLAELTPPPAGAVSGDVGLASQMAQQEAATAALFRRTQEANRAMVTEAERLRNREDALLRAEVAGPPTDAGRGKGGKVGAGGASSQWGGKGKGGKKGELSNRKKKALSFFAKHGRGGRRGGK